MKISGPFAGAAVAAGLALVGCGGGQRVAAGGRDAPVPYLPPPAQIEAVFVLEASGVPPEDTTLKIAAGQRRVILIRRGAPDNSLFARVELAATKPVSGADSFPVAIRPLPGRYGVELELPADSTSRVALTFSYALSFVAPAGARERYGSDLEFEKALLIARLDPNGRVTFLPTTSPGADLLTATVPGPGRYLVAAPRS